MSSQIYPASFPIPSTSLYNPNAGEESPEYHPLSGKGRSDTITDVSLDRSASRTKEESISVTSYDNGSDSDSDDDDGPSALPLSKPGGRKDLSLHVIKEDYCRKLIRRIMGVAFSALFLTSIVLKCYTQFNDGHNITATLLCMAIGVAAPAAFLSLARDFSSDRQLTSNVNEVAMSTFPNVFFALSQGILNVTSGTSVSEGLWTSAYVFGASALFVRYYQDFRRKLEVEPIDILDTSKEFHPRPGRELRPLLIQSNTRIGFWTINLAVPVIIGVGLFVGSTYAGDTSYTCPKDTSGGISTNDTQDNGPNLLVHYAVWIILTPTGFIFERLLVDKTRNDERAGIDTCLTRLCRKVARVGGRIAGPLWVAMFGLSRIDNPSASIVMRGVSGALYGWSTNTLERSFTEGAAPSFGSQIKPIMDYKVRWLPSFLQGRSPLDTALVIISYVTLAGATGFFIWQGADVVKDPASKVSAGVAAGFSVISFFASKKISQLDLRNRGRLTNEVIYRIIYNLGLVSIPYLVLSTDFCKIGSKATSEVDGGSPSAGVYVRNVFSWSSEGTIIGVSMVSRFVTNAFDNTVISSWARRIATGQW